MNKSKQIVKLLKENGTAGPRDEDIANYIFAALAGEKQIAGVKVKADKQPMRGAPLDITVEYPFRGKMYHIEARIPSQALRLISVT
jgi:hypothetical protein